MKDPEIRNQEDKISSNKQDKSLAKILNSRAKKTIPWASGRQQFAFRRVKAKLVSDFLSDIINT